MPYDSTEDKSNFPYCRYNNKSWGHGSCMCIKFPSAWIVGEHMPFWNQQLLATTSLRSQIFVGSRSRKSPPKLILLVTNWVFSIVERNIVGFSKGHSQIHTYGHVSHNYAKQNAAIASTHHIIGLLEYGDAPPICPSKSSLLLQLESEDASSSTPGFDFKKSSF